MKNICLEGISYLQAFPEGSGEWYYAMDQPAGDLYEAEELAQAGRFIEGSRLYLIRYPEGEVICPLEKKAGTAFGTPVFYDGRISILTVDFIEGMIRIHHFDCRTRELDEAAALPLSSVKDCYNLMLHEHPLTLTRQPNDGTFELIWPEKKTIKLEPTESFFYREDDRLFFNTWYEDPDYREETIIRSAKTGEILERMPGDVHIMPNGDLWHLW